MALKDPWGMLSKELPSRHCVDRKSLVVSYDHTGAIRARCECGAMYWHSKGAYDDEPESDRCTLPPTKDTLG